jgi:class 3 adenylate cyclase
MPSRSEARRLAAVLFTDIVGSTEVAAELGDARWRALLDRHLAIVRRELKRSGGRLNDTAGDGVFATFERPTQAIRCAVALTEAVRELGIEIRAGVHFGETERIGDKLGGIAVHTGARVMSAGDAGEVLVTAATRDLVAGSGFAFEDHGVHALKGIEGEQRLYRVTSVDGSPVAPPADPDAARERRAAVEPAPRKGRWPLVAVGTAVLIAVSVAAVLSADDDPASTATPGPAFLRFDPATEAAPSFASLDISSSQCGTFDPILAAGAGRVWAGFGLGLTSVDASSAAVGPSVAIQRTNSCSVGFTNAAGRGWQLWLLADYRFSQIDPNDGHPVYRTRLRAFAARGIPNVDLAVSDDTLWAAGGADVVRIDAVSHQQHHVHLPGISLDMVAYGDGALYGLDGLGGVLYRFDPVTLEVLDQVEVNVSLPVLRAGEGSVWLLDVPTGVVSRYAPSDLRPLGTVATGAEASDLAVGLGAAWVTVPGEGLFRIDAVTEEVRLIALDQPAFGVTIDPDDGPDGTIWLVADRASGENGPS